MNQLWYAVNTNVGNSIYIETVNLPSKWSHLLEHRNAAVGMTDCACCNSIGLAHIYMVKPCLYRPKLLHVLTFSCIGYLCRGIWEKAATKFHVDWILCAVIGVDYADDRVIGRLSQLCI